MSPKDVLLKLKTGATAKTAQTLDAIYEICQEQEDRGIYEFSPKVIAKLGHKRGVPKEQSLRNKSGERYRALLRAFEDSHSTKIRQVSTRDENNWIDELPNPKHRLLVRAHEAELKAAKKLLQDIAPPGERIDVYDYQHVDLNNKATLSDIERRALQYIISEEFLAKWGFTTSEYGEVVDSNGTIVLRAATVNAVEKALSNL